MWNRVTVGLLAGSSLAGFGTWLDFLAILTLAAYEYKADAYVMAFISALFLMPGMFLGPRIGRWVDKGNPRTILLSWLTIRALVTGLLLLTSSLWLFCILVAVRSFATIPTDPAANMLVSRLVGRDDVPPYFGVLVCCGTRQR